VDGEQWTEKRARILILLQLQEEDQANRTIGDLKYLRLPDIETPLAALTSLQNLKAVSSTKTTAMTARTFRRHSPREGWRRCFWKV
jgi:hypothetical protein